ncbi:helix-turn-helix domain-containing protein [Gordonia sputi]|nr:helix-turn-helix transcriptional regulator [Gordonia sputi]
MKRTTTQAGAIVAARRRELGLDVAELARTAGVDVKTIRSLEAGERMPRDSTKAKIERALSWDSGGIDEVMEGREPPVSGALRGSDGRVLNDFVAIGGAEQELLEHLMLAKLVMDARDFVRRRPSAENNVLARSLDEASELAIRAVARAEDYSLADAEWRINEERVANSIRRQGDVYVVEDPSRQSDYELVSGADRQVTDRTKGERLHDEMSAAGEESQVDPGEEG